MSQYKTTRSEMVRLIERLYRERHQHLPDNFVPTTAYYMTPIRDNEALLYKTAQYVAKHKLNTDFVRALVRDLHKALIQGSNPDEVFKTFEVKKLHTNPSAKDAPRGAFDFYQRVLSQLAAYEKHLKHLEDLYEREQRGHEITHEKLNRLHQKLQQLLPAIGPPSPEQMPLLSDIEESPAHDNNSLGTES